MSETPPGKGARSALDLLPHRPPMRLVEEVLEIDPGRAARTTRRARHEDWYFQGHFPGEPVMPAIILVELLAQTGGLAAHRETPDGAALDFRVAAFTQVKFPAAARPGSLLEATARVVTRMGRLVKIEGEVSADGILVAQGGLTLVEVVRSDVRRDV